MKLSDIMSAMQLAHYAEVALVIFFTVFVAVIAHVMRRELKSKWERARYLPLEEAVSDMDSSTRGTNDD